ncbi:centromere protein L-like [Oscarella lobularis]|uniref:centromere protein L-like n=1 Tax=Oscarella lobularis TaxID=121494 RepID=UPI00331357EC
MAERSRKAKRIAFTPTRTPEWKKKRSESLSEEDSAIFRRLSPSTPLSLASKGQKSPHPILRSLSASAKRSRRQFGLCPTPRHRKRNQLDDEILKRVTSKTWRTYRISYLSNFASSDSSMRRYSRSLTAFLKGAMTKGPSVVEEETTHEDFSQQDIAKAVVSILPEMKAFEDDNAGLSIMVFGWDAGNKEKVLLEAILCGCGVFGEDLTDGFTGLPLLLISGSILLGNHLVDWLKSLFDCFATRLELVSSQMNFLVSKWARPLEDASHHHKQVTLSYRWLGQAAENKLDFTVKLDQESINTMYIHNDISLDPSSEMTLEESKRFSDVLGDCIFRSFRLRLEALSLVTIATPVAKIKADGQVTIFAKNKTLEVIECLTKMADYSGDVIPV